MRPDYFQNDLFSTLILYSKFCYSSSSLKPKLFFIYFIVLRKLYTESINVLFVRKFDLEILTGSHIINIHTCVCLAIQNTWQKWHSHQFKKLQCNCVNTKRILIIASQTCDMCMYNTINPDRWFLIRVCQFWLI